MIKLKWLFSCHFIQDILADTLERVDTSMCMVALTGAWQLNAKNVKSYFVRP